VKPTLHIDSASRLPSPEGLTVQPLRLAAMALVPSWLRRVTDGRPIGCFATGDEVQLMEAALRARSNPLFASQGPVKRYRLTLEARWEKLIGAGALRPDTLRWGAHDGQREIRSVPSGSWLVCTCARGVDCHTVWLAPFLARAGWRVVLRGEEVPL